MTEPKLRPVPEDPSAAEAAGFADAGGKRRAGTRWALLLLAGALTVCLVLLIWSRAQLTGQIRALEAETRSLKATVTEQNRVINAQRGRLNDVKDRVDALQGLLNEPIPE